MARLTWAEPSLRDLEEIAEYIALDNPTAAKNLVQTVFKRVERLEQHPQSGRKPPEFKTMTYREVIVGPCRVFYRIDKKKIYVLYVMRGERQLRKYLLKERKKETFR